MMQKSVLKISCDISDTQDNHKRVLGLIQTKQCSFGKHSCDKNRSVKRQYLFLSAIQIYLLGVLFILQYFWVYFANFLFGHGHEKEVAGRFLATKVIFVLVLSLKTFL